MSTQKEPAADDSDPVAGRAVTVNILKGGVGKSAISMNTADRLAIDNDVLYMDLDPNGHVTFGLGFDDVYQDSDHDLGDVILDNPTKDPLDVIYETDWGFDFVPASVALESLDTGLKDASHASQRLHQEFLAPLMADGHYDYCIMDGGGERSKVADNAFYASKQCIIPIEPGPECLSGFKRTMQRVIKPLRKYQKFEILAIVPNKLEQRIDQQTQDRELLEMLNTSEAYQDKVPNFARITAEEFDKIDSGEVDPLKPGIRNDTKLSRAYEQGKPVAHYDPEAKSVPYLDELAQIIENGGVNHE
jgi:chromosome partitioning protein